MLCVTAYPCVLTSVPLTYEWAFGFVGCILFFLQIGKQTFSVSTFLIIFASYLAPISKNATFPERSVPWRNSFVRHSTGNVFVAPAEIQPAKTPSKHAGCTHPWGTCLTKFVVLTTDCLLLLHVETCWNMSMNLTTCLASPEHWGVTTMCFSHVT